MTTMTSQAMLEQLDSLDKFFARCPASKRGRPMDPGQAIHAEKANPGSVCMKISRARDGRGQRHIFYKVTSRAEKAAQKTTTSSSAKRPDLRGEKKTAKAASPEPKAKTSSDTPTFHSGIKGLREVKELLQQVGIVLKNNRNGARYFIISLNDPCGAILIRL